MLNRAAIAFRRLRASPAGREDRNIRRLMFHTALFGVVNGGVITFLPVLLVRLGASAITVSLLTSLPALVTILFALPAGVLTSRWRQLVPLSARCFFSIRLSYLAIAGATLLRPEVAPLLIVAIWGLVAIPSTLGNTVFYDVLAEAVPPRRRAAVNGARWALLGLVSAASVALFGQILEALPWPGNYWLLFAACFAAGLLSTWHYSQIEIPAREPRPAAAGRASLRSRAGQLLEPLRRGSGFLTFSLVTLALRLGFFLPAGVFSIFLVRDLQASDAWIGGRMTVESSALTVGYYVWGRTANRLGHWRMLALASVVIGGGALLTGAAVPETRWFLLVAALSGGFFASAVDVSLFEWLLLIMPPSERPRYVAMNTALANLVACVAPLAGAAIAERARIPPVLFASGGCLFVCAALSYWLGRPVRKSAARALTDKVQRREGEASQT